MFVHRSLLYRIILRNKTAQICLCVFLLDMSVEEGGWREEKAGQKLCVPSQAGMADRGRLQAAM